MVKRLVLPVDERLYHSFKHKCKFYEITYSKVITELVARFVEGEFDKDFNIKV
jgi:hypothetical protein